MDTGPVDVATALGSLVASAAWAVCMGRQVRALRQELSQAREDEACAREGAIATVATLRMERMQHEHVVSRADEMYHAARAYIDEQVLSGDLSERGGLLVGVARRYKNAAQGAQEGDDGHERRGYQTGGGLPHGHRRGGDRDRP
jgi:hypothetical protein